MIGQHEPDRMGLMGGAGSNDRSLQALGQTGEIYQQKRGEIRVIDSEKQE